MQDGDMTILRPLLAAALLLPALAPAIAQDVPMEKPGAKTPSRVTGGSYKTDPAHTMVVWTVDHMGFTPYSGIFADVSGTLTLDPKSPNAARVEVTIPVAAITTPNAALTKHLLSKDFFGTAPAPARFVSTRVVARGQAATITGNLTLNGVTKPVVLDAQFYGAGKGPPQMGGGENVGFTATTTIRRSEFALGYGVPIVSDAVELKIYAGFMK
jgi:polyisoprenoid-binding protein YceI